MPVIKKIWIQAGSFSIPRHKQTKALSKGSWANNFEAIATNTLGRFGLAWLESDPEGQS